MNTIFSPFAGMSKTKLLQLKIIYENSINEQSANYIPLVNKKTGKIIKPTSMPWMLPTWIKGLELINVELNKQ